MGVQRQVVRRHSCLRFGTTKSIGVWFILPMLVNLLSSSSSFLGRRVIIAAQSFVLPIQRSIIADKTCGCFLPTFALNRKCPSQPLQHQFLHYRATSTMTITSTTTTVESTRSSSSAAANGGDGDVQYGVDMDQYTLMETDKLVAVDEYDNLIPQVTLSKKVGHTFTEQTPRAALHRAFSLFVFNKDNKLLLTQRAASKITFPNVWTNTVCSHPLYDMTPDEADIASESYPHFPGIKHAAVRKGRHELGLTSSQIPVSQMQFITRFHYWAADTVTYGKQSPWGEHEVDYILFLKTNTTSIPVEPHPDEVSDYKYVSIDELRTMLQDPALHWSPWFLGIMERGGWDWWTDLEGALAGKYTNDKVTYFDPPEHHTGSYNLPTHTRQTGVLPSSSNV